MNRRIAMNNVNRITRLNHNNVIVILTMVMVMLGFVWLVQENTTYGDINQKSISNNHDKQLKQDYSSSIMIQPIETVQDQNKRVVNSNEQDQNKRVVNSNEQDEEVSSTIVVVPPQPKQQQSETIEITSTVSSTRQQQQQQQQSENNGIGTINTNNQQPTSSDNNNNKVKKPFIKKSDLVQAAIKSHGKAVPDRILECSPEFDLTKYLSVDPNSGYYSKKIMKQFSPNGCDGPLTISRLQRYLEESAGIDLHQGGAKQCPEVTEWYTTIAQEMKPNSIYCDVGFFCGSSSATFLLGGYQNNVEVHAFDNNFKTSSISLLQSLFGSSRLQIHGGDLLATTNALLAQGKKCDVIFLDAVHPDDMKIFRKMAKPETIVLYHWHFRNDDSREYFNKVLETGEFIEETCLKTWCTLTPDPASSPMIRESCLGRYGRGGG
jgi:hypothetical protein